MPSIFFLSFLLALSALAAIESKCPAKFKEKCFCGHKDNSYTVNCTNTRFTDTLMLEDLPEMTEVLIFTGNTLGELPENIFGHYIRHDALKFIDMSNNHITFIKGRTFHKVNNVHTLILNYNDIIITDGHSRPRIFSNFKKLKYLHLTDAFTDRYNATHYYLLKLEDIFMESFLSHLERLHLEQNEIWSIGTEHEKIFCPLGSIQHLYLADNKLSDMDFRIDCLKNLSFIDLRFNMISRLSEDAMLRLDQFSERTPLTIHLKDNPFMCDCQATSFLHWIKDSSMEFRERETYRCLDGSPQDNINKRLTEIEHVTCPGVPKGYSSGIVGFLSFLVVFLAVLVIVLLLSHRQKIASSFRPLVNDITSKIGYSGLDHEEPIQEVNV